MATNILGQTLLNQFRVDQFIASGGMGAVYRVYDLKRSVNLAMKVLHADLAEDSLFVKRFQREAEALQSLAHPHIVPFYGLYQAEDFAFLLEAYIDGQTLKEMVEKRRGQPFSLQEALTVLKAVCAALGYAHVNQVIHRDVKPANIMLDKGGNIYLTDFGIAQNSPPRPRSPTPAPPLTWRPSKFAARSPRRPRTFMPWVRCSSRCSPGGGPSWAASRARRPPANRPRSASSSPTCTPPSPTRAASTPSLPRSLSGVIAKALDKEPSRRFSGTQEFFNTCLEALDLTPGEIPDRWQDLARAFTPLASTIHEQVPVREPQPRQQPLTPAPVPPFIDQAPVYRQPQSEPQEKKKRSLLWLGLLLGLLVVVGCLFGGYSLYQRMMQPTREVENQVTSLVEQVEALLPTATSAVEGLKRLPTSDPTDKVAPTEAPTPTQGEVAVTGEKAVAGGVSGAIVGPTDEPSPTPIPEDPRKPPEIYFPLSACAHSRLHKGDWTYIKYGVDGLFLRSTPDVHVEDNIIANLADGELVLILGNPTCSYRWLMWEAQASNGLTGWISESDGEDFWLEPFPSWNACRGAAPSYLQKGEQAMVAPYPPDANRLRAEPSKDAERIGTIQPGEKVRVLDGPQCSEFTTWWLVEALSSGAQGWTAEAGGAEHWMLPIPRP